METKVNYAAVGLFVLALSAALVAGILWIASGGAFQKHYDLYLAIEEESVAGLNLNAPVKYNGVDVGKVRDIRLDPRDQARVNSSDGCRAKVVHHRGNQASASAANAAGTASSARLWAI